MKKLICMMLTLCLMAGCTILPAMAEETADYICEEENFKTRIPLNGSSGYEKNTGLVIYTDVPGYIPYVIVHRRPLDKKFNNPVNYLNNVYREYLEGKHEDTGTNPAKKWEVGGKELIGARYMYKIGKYTVVQVQLIEIREAGDVEYTAKYIQGEDAATMAALDTAVKYYQETDTDAVDQPETLKGEKIPEAPVLEPISKAGTEVDLENGTYWAKITDTAQILNGGYFTVELYESDLYDAAEVEALKPGDKVKLEKKTYTVKSIQNWLDHDDVFRMEPEEEFQGWMGFEKAGDGYYYGTIGNTHMSSFVTDVQIRMPLANAFSFVYVVAENDITLFDADKFVSALCGGEAWIAEEELSEDCTAVQFTDGLLTAIVHQEK